jgi:hypothetical protein
VLVCVALAGRARGGLGARVGLRATREGALGSCALADLKRFAVDLVDADAVAGREEAENGIAIV